MAHKKFSAAWKSSTQPRKQRKYRHNAPLHHRQKFVHVHLSQPLRQKYGLRSIQIRKDDKVKIVRGEFSKKEGKVTRVDLQQARLYIAGVERVKKDGATVQVSVDPSNVILVELELTDKYRIQKLEAPKSRKSGKGAANVPAQDQTKK